MVRERALRRRRFGYDIAHAGSDIALAEHDVEAGFENTFTERMSSHAIQYVRTYWMSSKLEPKIFSPSDFYLNALYF